MTLSTVWVSALSKWFAVWIDPGQMSDWYAPTDEFGPTVGEVDPHVGGHYRVGMLLPGRTEPRYVSKEKLAGRLGISERTIKTWRSRGLPAAKVGRELALI